MNLKEKFNSQKTVYLMLFVVLMAFKTSQAQSNDSTRYFGGSVAATNNGLSLLPTFSLNKPAALIMLNAGGKRLSFDPEFRFSLEDGKPWSFVFWLRYKLIQQDKFRLTIGAHPAYLFGTQSVNSNGSANTIITTERYVATEVAPNYFITKNTSVGIYYLRGRGFKESGVQNLNFVTFNANFNKIGIYKSFYLKFNPQIYYLKMDDKDGFYFTSTLTVATTNFPLSVQTIMNQTIESNIPSKDFIWNVSLIYSFGKQYKPI